MSTRPLSLKRMLLGRLAFSVIVTAAIGGTYWLSTAITMWLLPLTRIG